MHERRVYIYNLHVLLNLVDSLVEWVFKELQWVIKCSLTVTHKGGKKRQAFTILILLEGNAIPNFDGLGKCVLTVSINWYCFSLMWTKRRALNFLSSCVNLKISTTLQEKFYGKNIKMNQICFVIWAIQTLIDHGVFMHERRFSIHIFVCIFVWIWLIH